jgi:hypothetical protein
LKLHSSRSAGAWRYSTSLMINQAEGQVPSCPACGGGREALLSTPYLVLTQTHWAAGDGAGGGAEEFLQKRRQRGADAASASAAPTARKERNCNRCATYQPSYLATDVHVCGSDSQGHLHRPGCRPARVDASNPWECRVVSIRSPVHPWKWRQVLFVPEPHAKANMHG